MKFSEFEAMAKPAYPIDDDDYGSDRQVDAENAFIEYVESRLPQIYTKEFEVWSLKATTEERLDETLERIKKALA